MSETQARRVTVEFVVTGHTHADIVTAAETSWQRYLDEPNAKLPFDTEIAVVPSSVGGDLWEATVIVRRRGDSR